MKPYTYNVRITNIPSLSRRTYLWETDVAHEDKEVVDVIRVPEVQLGCLQRAAVSATLDSINIIARTS